MHKIYKSQSFILGVVAFKFIEVSDCCIESYHQKDDREQVHDTWIAYEVQRY